MFLPRPQCAGKVETPSEKYPLKMQVKTRSQIFMWHPRTLFLRELAGFSHGQAVPEYSYFPKIMSCVPGSFVGRMFLPLKNHIFGKLGSEMVWSKKGTPQKSSAALIRGGIKFRSSHNGLNWGGGISILVIFGFPPITTHNWGGVFSPEYADHDSRLFPKIKNKI